MMMYALDRQWMSPLSILYNDRTKMCVSHLPETSATFWASSKPSKHRKRRSRRCNLKSSASFPFSRRMDQYHLEKKPSAPFYVRPKINSAPALPSWWTLKMTVPLNISRIIQLRKKRGPAMKRRGHQTQAKAIWTLMRNCPTLISGSFIGDFLASVLPVRMRKRGSCRFQLKWDQKSRAINLSLNTTSNYSLSPRSRNRNYAHNF